MRVKLGSPVLTLSSNGIILSTEKQLHSLSTCYTGWLHIVICYSERAPATAVLRTGVTLTGNLGSEPSPELFAHIPASLLAIVSSFRDYSSMVTSEWYCSVFFFQKRMVNSRFPAKWTYLVHCLYTVSPFPWANTWPLPSPEQPLETTSYSVTIGSLPRTIVTMSKTNNIPWWRTWYSDGDSGQSSLANAVRQGNGVP